MYNMQGFCQNYADIASNCRFYSQTSYRNVFLYSRPGPPEPARPAIPARFSPSLTYCRWPVMAYICRATRLLALCWTMLSTHMLTCPEKENAAQDL